MQPHVKIRKDYVKLVRQGNKTEARKILQKIWNREIVEPEPVFVKTETDVEVKPKKSLIGLLKINGIGNKTLKDIKRIYSDIDELKVALKEDTVSLRDDVVVKLKDALL